MSFIDSIRSATSSDDLKVVELPTGVYKSVIIAISHDMALKQEREWGGTTYPEGHQYSMVTFKPAEIVEVDDEEEIEECTDWKEKIQNQTYYNEDEFKSGFIPLIAAAGLDIDDYITSDGFDIDQVSKDLLKKYVNMSVVRKYNEKRDRFFTNISKIGPIEE